MISLTAHSGFTSFFAFMALFCVKANAQTLAEYHFNGSPASLSPSFQDTTVSASNISFANVWYLGLTNEFWLTPADAATSPTAAVNASSYFEFTLAPNPGVSLNYKSISFDSSNQDPGPGHG